MEERTYKDHEFDTSYSYDKTHHWFRCKKCGAKSSCDQHNIDDSGYCIACDAPVGATKGILYDKTADGTYAEVIGYSGSAKRIVIAEEYDRLPVKSIYEKAFYNSSITSVAILDSVTPIGSYVFQNCDSLTSVEFNNTDGWFVSQDSNATSGTKVNLTDKAMNATYLKSTYLNYY